MEWLGHGLARRGFVALAVSHHGNSAIERYRLEGFACLWERARDLTCMLDSLHWIADIASHINTRQVFVAGFSAGAYAAMLLLGAQTSSSPFYGLGAARCGMLNSRQFPDIATRIPRLFLESAVFRESWKRMSASYLDTRFTAGLLLAPGPSVLGFAADSLAEIRAAVRIVVGDGDKVAPASECSDWLHHRLRNSMLEILRPNVGHYIFLPKPSRLGLRSTPEYFTDVDKIRRSSIHARLVETSAAFFHSTMRNDRL